MIDQAQNPESEDADAGIRLLIEQELKEPLSDGDWGFLILESHVAKIRFDQGERTKKDALVKSAARTIRNLRAAHGEPVIGTTEPARRMDPKEGHRRWALSRLLALEAEDDEQVAGFRLTHLAGYPDNKLEWEKIGDWIAEQAQLDGPPTEFALLALPAGARREQTLEGLKVEDSTPLSEAHVENSVSARIVKYGVPGGKWVQTVAVCAGGVLDELWHASAHLVKRYGWKEDQATVFVLTGVTPYMPGIRLETVYESNCPAASRITLVIDPFVPPQEVLSTYTRLRQRILSGRYRPLSEKHLKLAVFAAENKREGATWVQVMEMWNREHEDEKYTQETVFARDCTMARKRLLSPRLNPDGLLEMVADEEKRAD